jgi:sirohydrochlorin cobaltochelatase
MNEDKTGIVVVGHGSRIPVTKEVYEGVVEIADRKSSYTVRVAYMKHHEPNLIEAVQGLINEGFKRIVVVPLFLLPGLHVTEDIPILLGLREGEVPEFGYQKLEVPEDVQILYANHVGADERLADIVLDRAEEVLG